MRFGFIPEYLIYFAFSGARNFLTVPTSQMFPEMRFREVITSHITGLNPRGVSPFPPFLFSAPPIVMARSLVVKDPRFRTRARPHTRVGLSASAKRPTSHSLFLAPYLLSFVLPFLSLPKRNFLESSHARCADFYHNSQMAILRKFRVDTLYHLFAPVIFRSALSRTSSCLI